MRLNLRQAPDFLWQPSQPPSYLRRLTSFVDENISIYFWHLKMRNRLTKYSNRTKFSICNSIITDAIIRRAGADCCRLVLWANVIQHFSLSGNCFDSSAFNRLINCNANVERRMFIHAENNNSRPAEKSNGVLSAKQLQWMLQNRPNF